MSTASVKPPPDFEIKLPGRLEDFVNAWKNFRGTEQSGAQDFLRKLLEIYEVEYIPGTVFEQHPVRIPARSKAGAQPSLFATDEKPEFTTERMDMYLPKVCVWEMKAPSEKHLD